MKLTVDGKLYEVDVDVAEPEQPQPTGYLATAGQIRAPEAYPHPVFVAAPSKSTGADEAKFCRSPISGLVIRVLAQVGQSIKANDVLVVVEAMKMETAITSPVHGKIAAVRVGSGESVQANQVLIQFE